jgi:hypothetical protein
LQRLYGGEADERIAHFQSADDRIQVLKLHLNQSVSTLPIFKVFLLFGLSWLLCVFLQFILDQRVVGLVDIVIILHLLGKDIDVVASNQPGEVFAVLKDVTEGIPKVKK